MYQFHKVQHLFWQTICYI